MKLITAKSSAVKGAFIVSADPSALKKLKSKKVFYPYVTDGGRFGQTGGLFADDPIDPSDLAKFHDQAEALFKIRESDDQDVAATFHLRGNRIKPTTFTISDVSDVELEDGTEAKKIEGRFENAHDPRLPFLDGSESTEFGQGSFDVSKMFGVYDGSYVYLTVSPNAESIAEIADRQRRLFESYLKEPTAPTKSELDRTSRLLRPHAHEIYRIDGDRVYYINKGGRWQMHVFTGLRHIDVDDRMRLRHLINDQGTDEAGLKKFKEGMPATPLLDRLSPEDVAPLLHQHLKSMEQRDAEELATRRSAIDHLKPTDVFDGLPGLRDHVELFPHQSYVLSHIKDRDRMLVDVDPGGGKMLIIVCDVLQQLKKNPGTRALVVMPDSLLGQAAAEIKHFSELNPWIINTEAIHRWKSGDFETFIEDAGKAPANTVFLTSYYWISHETADMPSGHIIKTADPETGDESYAYRNIRTFPRVDSLLDRLGVNAVYRDECHLMRNESNVSRAAASLARAPVVRDLTGTIMPGNLIDVTGSMGSLHSGVFGSNKAFLKRYSENGTPNSYKPEAPKEIRKELRDFGVPQVRKSAWASLLPKVSEYYHFVKFTPSQQKVYESLLNNTIDEIQKDPILSRQFKRFERELSNGEAISSKMVLARFTPLDVFLNAPSKAKNWTSMLTGEDAKSPKAKRVSKIAKEHLAKPEAGKVLVFVQFKEAAKNLLENLDPDIEAISDYYEGGMVDVLNRFKNPESNLKVLIAVDATLRAGHNLQVADCLVNADECWTPGEMLQREARAIRLKQARPVELHHIVVKDSAEMLKVARMISSEHMIAKANSDFEDDAVLPQLDMTMNGMKSFRTLDALKPFLGRRAAIKVDTEDQAVVDRERFGIRPIKPRIYPSINVSVQDARQLDKVPSSRSFKGDANDVENLVDKELSSMPLDPRNPRVLKFNLQQWDDNWYMTAWRSADPQGYVRRLGFKFQRHFWSQEVPSRGGATALLKKIEDAGFTISNQEEFDEGLRSVHRLLHSGQRNIMRKSQMEARKAVAASFLEKVEAAKEKPALEAAFHFATIDGYPVVFTDSVADESPEIRELKKLGFKLQQPFWYLPITKTRLRMVLTKMTNYGDLRIADWDEFAMSASKVFMGINLDEFTDLEYGKQE